MKATSSAPGRWRPLVALIAGFTVLRLLLAALAPMLPQEAYYWTWSRYLDASYFDHPPLASYAIALTTSLLGSTAFGVKTAAVLWSLGWNVLWARLIVDFYADFRLAWWSLLALNLTVVYELLGLGPTPDGPLIFGWIGAIWCIGRAFASERGGWWLAAGGFVGLACLGKYTGALLPVVALLFLAASPAARHWLRRPEPYLGLLLAALLFAPVLYWNARHEWVSLAFQSSRRLGEVEAWKPRFVAVLVASQLLVVTPWIIFIALRESAHLGRQWLRQRIDGRDLLLLLSGLLPLAAVLSASFFVNAKVQWLAPAWWALIVLGVRGVLARGGRIVIGLATSAVVVAAVLTVALVPDTPIPGDFNSWSGWEEASRRVDAHEAALRAAGVSTFVFSPSYKSSSLLWFHRGRQERTYAQDILGKPALQYDYFPKERDLTGATGLFVSSDQAQSKPDLAALQARFDSVVRIDVVRVERFGRPTRNIEIWQCSNYHPPKT